MTAEVRDADFCPLLIAPFTTCGEPVFEDSERCAAHYIRTIESIARSLSEELAVVRKAVGNLTYASNDGTEYEHNGHGPMDGEPECPACWAVSIRTALAGASR